MKFKIEKKIFHLFILIKKVEENFMIKSTSKEFCFLLENSTFDDYDS